MTEHFRYGIDELLASPELLSDSHAVGMVSHPAGVTTAQQPSWQALQAAFPNKLKALFGPEHGFAGKAGAGEKVQDEHLEHLPVFSLYGNHRKPTKDMLDGLDTLIVDFQDISTRCYTYVSTLDLVLEAASEAGLRVIVTDRPSPLAHCLDGPVLDPAFKSFVGQVPCPMVYGLTPGEAARWLSLVRGYSCSLAAVPMTGYMRSGKHEDSFPPWHPPSPAIHTWETAQVYPSLVFVEAFPFIGCSRSTPQAFLQLSSEEVSMERVLAALADQELPGLKASLVQQDRLSFHVQNPTALLPVRSAVTLISAIQQVMGRDGLWHHEQARPEFFDKLFGTDKVRQQLQENVPAEHITASWQQDLEDFRQTRREVLLYEETP